MSDPKKPKVLTRLRIDEVSMVDRGAGANCKVVISKRDDGPDYHDLLTGRTTCAELYGFDKRASADGDEHAPGEWLAIARLRGAVLAVGSEKHRRNHGRFKTFRVVRPASARALEN